MVGSMLESNSLDEDGAEDAIRATVVPLPEDPLVLDLDGDGIETSGATEEATVFFDFNGDGTATATGWIKPDDGWLVWDRNNNGTIDSGRELFGDQTIKRDSNLAEDGFDALADEDINTDGMIWRNRGIYWLEAEGRQWGFRMIWFD